jgi:hypothetical protein
VKDLAVRRDVEGPSRRETHLAQDTIGSRDFLGRIRQDWVVGFNVLSEFLVLLRSVDADREVCDVELPNRFAALTERLTFGRSPAGEGFRKPGEHDGALALEVGK